MEFRSVGKPKRGQNVPQEKNIQVVVRCRPRSVAEKRNGSLNAVECNTRKGEISVRQEVGEKTTTKTFTFDKVYGTESRQIDVYRGVVEPLIEEVLMGYNCTVFAYGQTGTGKTFTMEGERSLDGSLSWEEDPLAGIIPRALHELFAKIEAQDVSEFSIRVSFLELYNEELFDLLSPVDDPAAKLRIFEDSARKGSVVVHGLEELQVHSKNEVFSILERGRAKRQTASTLLNAQSSRSHSVFSVTVHIKENSIEGEELLKTGKLNLVDLAGSENISRSGAVDKRAREAGQINQSLLTLGRVITSLVERAPHVPYRESKLTRILQDSLGGRTKTSIIATIGPASCNLEETLSTLDYAHRAKNITNRPEINQRLTKRALIKEYTDEIERLKRDLVATREKNGVFISPENYAGMETLIRSQKDAMVELEARIAANQEEISKLNTLFTNSKAELEETAQRLEQTSYRLVTTKEHLATTRRNLHQTRVEREQKNFLVEEHARTEQTLLGQAGELIEVVEGAIGDVSGLHSKLDRKTRVEATNTATTQRFQKAVEGEFDQMRRNLEDFHSTQRDFYHTFSTGIETWCSEQLGIIQSLQQAVESVANTFQQFHQSHSNTSRGQTAATQEMVSQSKASTKHFQASLASTSDDMMSSSLLPLLGLLGNQLALQSSSLSQSATSLKSQLHSHEEFMSQFVCDQTQKIKNLSATVQRENSKQQAIMSGQQESIAAALESQRDLSKSLRASVMAEMGCLLERVMSQQQEQLGANMALVSLGIKNAAQSQQSHADHLHREFSVLNSDLSTFGSSCERSTASTMASVDTMLTEYNSAAEQQEQSAKKMRAELEKGVTAMKEMSERHADEHCTKLEDISSTIASHAHQAEEEIEAQVSMTSQSCSSLHSSLRSLATAGVSQPASQWSEDTATLSLAAKQFVESQNQAIERAGKTVTTYVSEELKMDVPTGQTPQRRDFSYPQQLARTRPHSDLLRDFRPSITLPELPESDTEEETGTDTVSPSVPAFDLSQDSSELETTTTSVDSSVSKISVSELQLAGEEQGKKENNLSTHTPALSKIPMKKKYVSGGGKSSSGKKRPLTVKN